MAISCDAYRLHDQLDQGRSKRGQRIFTLSINAHGYQEVNLEGGFDGTRTKLVHRLAAMTWLKNPDVSAGGPTLNAVKIDNRAANLDDWCSHSQNSRYAAKHGCGKQEGQAVPAKARPHLWRIDGRNTGDGEIFVTDTEGSSFMAYHRQQPLLRW